MMTEIATNRARWRKLTRVREAWLSHVTAVEWILVTGGIGGSILIMLLTPKLSSIAVFLLGIGTGAAVDTIREIPRRRDEKAKENSQLRQREEDRRQHEEERSEDKRQIEKLYTENRRLLTENEKLLEFAKASEDRDRICSEVEASSAYVLGWCATILPTKTDSIQGNIASVRSLCSDLGLRFSDTEQKLLESPSASQTDSQQISRMVLTKARDLPQRLWCFFELGNRTPWLEDQAKSARSTKAATDWLEAIRRNPLLPFAPRFVRAVGELLEAFRPYCNAVPDDARELLKRKVSEALDRISHVYIQGRNTQTACRRSPWFYTDDQGGGILTCIIEPPDASGDLMLCVRDANTYELSKHENGGVHSCRVNRDDAGWHCSAHVDASTDRPCLDIRLVVAVTDDGNPPTEAEAVIGVRPDPDSPSPKGSSTHET